MRELINIILIVSSFSFGQDRVYTPKEKDIVELASITNIATEDLITDIGEMMKLFTEIDEESFGKKIAQLKSITHDADYYDLYIPFYDKYFTHSEIKDLLEFYKSPTGQKTLKLTTEMTLDETKIVIQISKDLGHKLEMLMKGE